MTTPNTVRTRAPLAVRIVVVMVATMGIWALMAWLNDVMLADGPTIAVRLINAAVITGLAVPMVVLARRYLDRRPWAGLELQSSRRAVRPFFVGVIAFLAPSALGLTVAMLFGWVDLRAQVPWAEILGWAALLVVLVFFFEALPEELIFRGYLQRNLSTAMSPWIAAIAQAVLFTIFGTALWVATEGWGVLVDRGIMFFAMAIVLGLVRIQSGSVWTAVGFHLAFQVVAQSVLSERMSTGNEFGLMLAAIATAFVFATTIVGWFYRGDVNWSRPEPE